MRSDRSAWLELGQVYEDLLCKQVGLAKPLSQHGKLLDALKTLVNALSPSTKKKDEVYRYPSRTRKIIIRLDWIPLGSGSDSRNRVLINPADVTLLWNAILLQGMFGEPKLVATLLDEKEDSSALIGWARDLFLERQSLAGLGLLRPELMIFLDRLPVANLREEPLPNPFADTLPQMGLGHLHGNVLKALATQTAALSLGDSMMTHYLSGNLEMAYQAAKNMKTENPVLLQYQEMIVRQYTQANEFDDLLDSFR